jgi:hypothetical protein
MWTRSGSVYATMHTTHNFGRIEGTNSTGSNWWRKSIRYRHTNVQKRTKHSPSSRFSPFMMDLPDWVSSFATSVPSILSTTSIGIDYRNLLSLIYRLTRFHYHLRSYLNPEYDISHSSLHLDTFDIHLSGRFSLSWTYPHSCSTDIHIYK